MQRKCKEPVLSISRELLLCTRKDVSNRERACRYLAFAMARVILPLVFLHLVVVSLSLVVSLLMIVPVADVKPLTVVLRMVMVKALAEPVMVVLVAAFRLVAALMVEALAEPVAGVRVSALNATLDDGIHKRLFHKSFNS
jgi:hypothetical protein